MRIDIALSIVRPRPVAFWVSKPIPTWITDLCNFFYSQSRLKEKERRKNTTVSTEVLLPDA